MVGQFRKVLFWSAGLPAGRVGEMENKAISASNLKLKLKLTEAELGKIKYKVNISMIFQIS